MKSLNDFKVSSGCSAGSKKSCDWGCLLLLCSIVVLLVKLKPRFSSPLINADERSDGTTSPNRYLFHTYKNRTKESKNISKNIHQLGMGFPGCLRELEVMFLCEKVNCGILPPP